MNTTGYCQAYTIGRKGLPSRPCSENTPPLTDYCAGHRKASSKDKANWRSRRTYARREAAKKATKAVNSQDDVVCIFDTTKPSTLPQPIVLKPEPSIKLVGPPPRKESAAKPMSETHHAPTSANACPIPKAPVRSAPISRPSTSAPRQSPKEARRIEDTTNTAALHAAILAFAMTEDGSDEHALAEADLVLLRTRIARSIGK